MEAQVRKPAFKVIYDGTNITADVSADLISLQYTDRLTGESDEVSITVDASVNPWLTDWYPKKGSTLDVEMGYEDDMFPCGKFTIDEMDVQGFPFTLSIKALSAGANSPARTKKSKAYETQSLKEIADAIAAANGYTINDGTITTSRYKANFTSERDEMTKAATDANRALSVRQYDTYKAVVLEHYSKLNAVADSLATKNKDEFSAEIRNTVELWRSAWTNKAIPSLEQAEATIRRFIARLQVMASQLKDVDTTTTRSKLDAKINRTEQSRQTDLAFLTAIAARYGVLFNLRGTEMTFTSMYDIAAAGEVVSISVETISSVSFKDSLTATYSGARVTHHDPIANELVVAEYKAPELPGIGDFFFGGDTMEISEPIETIPQGEEVAKAALYSSNVKAKELSIDLPGNPAMLAGVNVNSTLPGEMGGTFNVKESSHKIDRSSGYTTSATLLKVKKKQ